MFGCFFNPQVKVRVTGGTFAEVFSGVDGTDDDISVRVAQIISAFKGICEYH